MPTTASPPQIRSDFDVIAALVEEGGGGSPYEEWLLANLPPSRGAVLEIGCGVGHLSRRLAKVFARVVAIDFSAGMIAAARRHTDAPVDYVCAEMFAWLDEHTSAYDCIVTVATLHHVDLATALRSMAHALKPGGRLLVLDLEERTGWRHVLSNGVTWLYSLLRTPRALRRAFREHGRHETYLTAAEVRRVAAAELPGARVRSHFLARYSIVWDKPLAIG